MKKIPTVFLFLFFFVVYSLLGWVVLDPDFGWRIRIGQLIIATGIPETDPFSFTMSRYPFVDHEWLLHVLLYAVHTIGGRVLLSVIFGSIGMFVLILVSDFPKKKEQTNQLALSLVFLVGCSIFSAVGIRPQVLGWLFFVLWVRELRKGPRLNIFVLFVLQLAWVNIHGSFFLGLFTFCLCAVSLFVQKKGRKKHIAVFILLCCLTFINPYGWHIWKEVWMTLSDTALRWRIQEWGPGLFVLDTAFWFYCSIFLSVFVKFRKNLSLFNLLLIAFFFLSAIASARNMPFFLLVSFGPLLTMWGCLVKEIAKEKQKQFILLRKVIVFLCVFVGLARVGGVFFYSKPIEKVYPVKAVAFLERINKEGRLYTEYDWGGYIIWRAPLFKVFIDGRMPSWRWKQNNKNQSDNIEKEYVYLKTKARSFEPYKKKYTITHALVKKGKDNLLFLRYKKLYEDELSVVYEL